MSEVVTANLEKIFLTYILQNPNQISRVEPHFFQNESIQFVYGIIRDGFVNSKSKIVPKPQQIVTMVRSADPNQESVKNEILKTLLKNDNSDHDKEYVEQKFRAWKLSNMVRNNVHKTIDEIRGMNDIDYDNVSEIASKIKAMYSEVSLLDDDEEDLGEDFDDPESHKQDLLVNKIKTGWNSIDVVTGGGWDLATFNIFLGETSIGKCTDYQTLIKIRNKKTKDVLSISIGDFYKMIKNK